tara:strand:+ start:1960 stop:2370 length:411 start_codon:yes stop_codon:yes gene_type:complete
MTIYASSLTAKEAIKADYSPLDIHNIYNYGCDSGVATAHIYYWQTTQFFKEYEDEIVDYLVLCLGKPEIVKLFSRSDCSLRSYMNNAVWTYIELIASELMDEFNLHQCYEDLEDSWKDDEREQRKSHLKVLDGGKK